MSDPPPPTPPPGEPRWGQDPNTQPEPPRPSPYYTQPEPPYGQDPLYGQQPPYSQQPPYPQQPQHPPYGQQPQYYPQPYGYWPPDPYAPYGYDAYGRPYSHKTKLAAGLLGIFLGGFGAGRFYMGDVNTGIAQLVVSWVTCGMGSLWGLIDGIMILANGALDSDGRPLRDS